MTALDRLIAFRKSQGMNHAQLARALGVHCSYVSKVEAGERTPSSVSNFTARLEVLSENWRVNGKKVGPIRATEWLAADAFKVEPLPARAASR